MPSTQPSMVEDPVAELVGRQQALLRDHLARFVGPGSDYALLDFPDYANVGDSAIWLGAISVLTGLTGRQPFLASRADGFRAEALERLPDGGVIFINGGGNFGDIWQGPQMFRESILSRFRDRTIVQLPQSIHYGDEAAADRTAKVIADTSDFHLFVRDHKSMQFAETRLNCAATLAPDCAMGMGPLDRRGPVEIDLLWLLRSDVERDPRNREAPGEGAIVEDWLEEPPMPRGSLRRAAVWDMLKSGSLSLELTRTLLLNRIAAHRLERGLRQLSRARHVVTDRLHSHILCAMMGIPHVVLDNSYGKVSGYRNCWHGDLDIAVLAGSAAEIPQALKALDALGEPT
ncbi:polysaccharide pyruvyl transferase family protein [Alteraurantiacibacter aquimixticola]|uniref:Exopolysaccharide biosynthesis protein n=1 Tax=Alteraurantiacibacter aquimixticola TaxID=2489173 RepID=A0A4T3F475_9SPHN|nr:polysaccharide pyruvyl transferase family protein [Alteraurantiacibacter aquimixticola]TIX51239.1 exopolysaccharide biosynthesis protein [Alteraurantiacibacter aquimixticola]